MARVLNIIAFIHLKCIFSSASQQKQSDIDSEDPFEISKRAFFSYELGNVSEALQTLAEKFQKFSSVEMLQTSYLTMLLKVGNYQKMLELKNIKGQKNLEMIEIARTCLKAMMSKDISQIVPLIDISPDSLEINIAVINNYLQAGNPFSAQQHLVRLEKIYPNDPSVLNIGIIVNMALKKMDKALATLKRVNSKLYATFTSVNTTIDSILKISNIDQKLSRLVNIYRELYDLYNANSSDQFGIYFYLYKLSIKKIVEIGCDNFRSVESFSRLLLKLEKDEFSIYYFIKSLIVDKKLKLASEELAKYDSELGYSAKNSLKQFIDQVQKKIQEEEKAREEEKRRKAEWEQEQRNRAYERQATNKAGQDFLKYYELLGAKKNATPDELKKTHRKKVREATKKAAKKGNADQEQKDSEVKLINKAYQILSDPEKRKMYDLGIDPEKGPQQGGGHYYHQGGQGSYFDEDQINEIFQSFFGGGGRQQGGRHQRRTQFVFL